MNYNAEDQYQSMVRAFAEIELLATNLGKHAVIGDDAVLDKAKVFFQQCYHLKDYLKKDPRIKNAKDVEAFINKSDALSIAADICNSFKHAGLTKPPRSGRPLTKINMAYSIDTPMGITGKHLFAEFKKNPNDGDTVFVSRSNRKGVPIATATVVFTMDKLTRNAIDLARECIADWRRFLLGNGVVFDEPTE